MADDDIYTPALPAAVQRQADRADELMRQITEPGGDNPGDAPVDPNITTVVNEPQPPLPGLPEPAPAPVEPAPAPVDWEQRYNTLQGKYNTELPELRGQVAGLRDLIATMQAEPAPAPSPAPATSRLPPAQEDVETYGADLIAATQRWAEAAYAPRMAEMDRRLAAVETGTQKVQAQTLTQRVEAALDHEIPTWRQINDDPSFHQWLAEVDPFAGRTRKEMADEAYTAGDSARTVRFFRAYLAEHTAVRPTPSGIHPTQTDNSAGKMPLEMLAVPGRGPVSSSPTPGAPEPRIWTRQEIATFYRDQQRGRYRNGREAEAERIERDILAASAEGRVRS